MVTTLVLLLIAGFMAAAYKKVGSQPLFSNTGLNVFDDFVSDFAAAGSHTFDGLFFSGEADLNGVVESLLPGDPNYLGAVRMFTAIVPGATAHLESYQKFATSGSSYIDMQTRAVNLTPLIAAGEEMERTFGLSDSLSDRSSATNCAVIYHDSAVSDYFICLVKNSDDSTVLQELTDVLANTADDHYFRIIVNTGKTYFYIDNQLVAEIDSSPAEVVGGLSIGWGMKSVDTLDNHPMMIDAIVVRQELLEPRQFV